MTDGKQEPLKGLINGVAVEYVDVAEKRKLTIVLNKLKQIPTGQNTLNELAESNTVVSLEPINGWGAFLPKDNRIVLLKSGPNNKLCSTLVHEARHKAQYQNGCEQWRGNDLDVQSQIMMDRAKEADAQVAALTACFEWADRGDQKPFQAFHEKTPEMYNNYFFRRKKEGFKAYSDKAKSAMFEGWYEQHQIKLVYERNYMGRLAMRELADVLECGATAGGYTKAAERLHLTPEQVLKAVGANYVKDAAFLTSEKALAVSRPIKELLSLSFELNGRKDASLDAVPTMDRTVTATEIHALIQPLSDAKRRCEYRAARAAGMKSPAEIAVFLRKKPDERYAIAKHNKIANNALSRVHSVQIALDMFDCLPKISQEAMSARISKDEAKRFAAQKKVDACENKVKSCRKTLLSTVHPPVSARTTEEKRSEQSQTTGVLAQMKNKHFSR